jgi:hypothetical protein
MLTAVGKKTWWAWAVGTFFGTGLMKPGPGTYGSVAAMLLWVVAAHVWGGVGLAVGTAIAAVRGGRRLGFRRRRLWPGRLGARTRSLWWWMRLRDSGSR